MQKIKELEFEEAGVWVCISSFVRTYSVIVLNCFENVSTYLETDKIQPLKQIDSRIKLTVRAVYVTAREIRVFS